MSNNKSAGVWVKASKTKPIAPKDPHKLNIKYNGEADLIVFSCGLWYWVSGKPKKQDKDIIREESWFAIEWLDESQSPQSIKEGEIVYVPTPVSEKPEPGWYDVRTTGGSRFFAWFENDFWIDEKKYVRTDIDTWLKEVTIPSSSISKDNDVTGSSKEAEPVVSLTAPVGNSIEQERPNDLSPKWIEQAFKEENDKLKKLINGYAALNRKDTHYAQGIERCILMRHEILSIIERFKYNKDQSTPSSTKETPSKESEAVEKEAIDFADWCDDNFYYEGLLSLWVKQNNTTIQAKTRADLYQLFLKSKSVDK